MTRRVRFIPSTPRSIARGGQEIQAEKTMLGLQHLRPDWDVRLLDFDAEEPPADIYHLVGNSESLWGIIRFLSPDSRLFVSAIHGVREDSMLKRSMKQSITSIAAKFGERSSYGNIRDIFRRAEHVFALTEPSKTFISNRYSIPSAAVSVVPNGVDDTFFSYAPGNVEDILILGSIIDRKSAAEVLDFAASHQGASYNFHFVGEGLSNEAAYFERFTRCADDLDNVHLHGALRQDQQAFGDLMNKCGVFLQLSKAETQSLAALEAIAAGKACVFLDRPHATLAPFDDWPRLADFRPETVDSAIEQALSRRQALDCRSRVSTWTDVAKMILARYDQGL